MDLNGYFDPVSLERPGFHFLPEEHSFSRAISIHTPDQPIQILDGYQVALVGIPQDEGAYIKGSNTAPDEIRGMLYQLRNLNNNVKVYDLGNLKITKNIYDTYYAIRDISLELSEKGIVPFFIGGSQDLSYGVLLALQKLSGIRQVLTIDPRMDFWPEKNSAMNSRNYLNYLLNSQVGKNFIYSNLAHQLYFVSKEQNDLMETRQMESMRLGEIRDNIRKCEPIIRDAEFVSIDLNAVRHSDAPGVTTPSPNGLFGDELCALTRYAGMSDRVKFTGIYEVAPSRDLNGQTSHLAAQAIWYFIEGFSHRIKENPLESSAHTKKFIVAMTELDKDLVFYKSTVSERWWVELPIENDATKQNFFISCSYEDYQQACNNEIPERWWRYFRRLSN